MKDSLLPPILMLVLVFALGWFLVHVGKLQVKPKTRMCSHPALLNGAPFPLSPDAIVTPDGALRMTINGSRYEFTNATCVIEE